MNKIVLISGSNIGDRFGYIDYATSAIENRVGEILVKSQYYETEAWGFESEKFINQVVVIGSKLEPLELLNELQLIEKDAGRVRFESDTYNARTLDIDILFYNDSVIDSEHLIVPHPHIAKRKFVLAPLVEINPDFIHPVLKVPVSKLFEECEDNSDVLSVVQ